MSSFKKAWRILNQQQRKYFIFIFFLMFISMLLESLSIGVIFPLLSVILKGEIDSSIFAYIFTFGRPTGEQLIYIALSTTVIIFIAKNLFLIFNNWYQIKFLQKVYLEMSDKLFKEYLKKDYIFFLQRNTSQLVRNVREEVASFTEYVNKLSLFIGEVIIFLGVSSVLFYVDMIGTIIILLTVSVLAYIIHIFTKGRIGVFGKQRILIESELNKHVIQGIAAAKDVKILDREEDLIHQYYKNLVQNRKIKTYINFINSLPRLLFEILIVCAFLILVLSMLGLQRNMLDIIQYLGVFAVASFRIVPSAARIFTSFQAIKFRIPTINLLSKEFFGLNADRYKSANSHPTNSKTTIGFEKEINLTNLSFSYPIRKEFSISGISMCIKKGEFIGIIGETGSGKSTLINLFTGLLKPSIGKIEVDKKNIDSNLSGWHKKIGYVPQSIFLMDDTIRKNIAFGLKEEDIDDNLINQALEKASLTEFVKNLPDGLETVVGEKGIRISGGQQQRIGIARALYRDPEILILDEATSSLDYITEKKIMDSINFLKRTKTLVVVTHRLSTIDKCDKIFFINKGKITKQGSSTEVLKDI